MEVRLTNFHSRRGVGPLGRAISFSCAAGGPRLTSGRWPPALRAQRLEIRVRRLPRRHRQTITLDDQPVQIVGVLPANFRYGDDVQLWSIRSTSFLKSSTPSPTGRASSAPIARRTTSISSAASGLAYRSPKPRPTSPASWTTSTSNT